MYCRGMIAVGGLIRIHIPQDCIMSSSKNNTITAKRLSYPIYHKYLSGATCAEQSNENVILESLFTDRKGR